MSRKLAPLFLAMLVLAGAMGLKTAVATAAGTQAAVAKNGSAPVPQIPWKNGSAPVPQIPW